MNSATLILGNQLFDYKYYEKLADRVFMCEDFELCTHFKYHKHKIIHFLSSMREFREYLKSKGKNVEYHELASKPHFLDKLKKFIKEESIEHIQLYEVEDHFFEQKLLKLFEELKVEVEYLQNPMFSCSRAEFRDYLLESEKPFMNSFYIMQRKKLKILLEEDGKPVGGSWSFDSENRKKIPKKFDVANFKPPKIKSKIVSEVSSMVEEHFADHPGEVDNYWIPTNRKDSIKWFKSYLKERFVHFGDFQDAIDTRAPFLYHSLISPLMNIGFLLPGEVVREVVKIQTADNLNAVEGFVRQVIGWREFVRGIYQNFDVQEQEMNFFKHERKLTKDWYEGTTGIPPVDDAILKAQKWGYCHHIERLMVVGNLMLLLKIHPKEVYRWFMEMFVDSSDWVMGPNVFGMSQFSDGGLFATKPYICGSNYLLKMSHYKKGDWCDGVDGLYWKFIDEKREFFAKNHRMSMMVSLLDKMDDEKKSRIFKASESLMERISSAK